MWSVKNDIGKIVQIYAKKKLDHHFIPYTGKLQMDKNLDLRLGTKNILRENIGSKILDISYSNIFLTY